MSTAPRQIPADTNIAALLARRRAGFALEQAFYASDAVYKREIDGFFMREWHFAGHVSQIPEPGDFFLFDLMDESVILTRDATGTVQALANVCRHRGSRVCLEQQGKTKRFTCPYHAWTYNLDGTLFSARLMDAGIDRAGLGLKPVPVEIFHGMIFVCFSDTPASFEQMRAELDPLLAPFGLEHLRIACRKSYPVQANWKLMVENYNECYHCAPAHPEFSRAHPTHMDAGRMQPLNKALEPRAQALGIPTDLIDRVGPTCPDGSVDYTLSRHALHDGVQTGSADGLPVAPLLGGLTGYDGGASDLYVGILNPMLIYNDHVVIYRFLPVDRHISVQEIIWLVRDDAVEGRDYVPERLTWLWDVTTQADKWIIENNQQGVNSRYYEPGPLAEMEAYTQRFIDLYAARLTATLNRDGEPETKGTKKA
jgi:Rieske 2Fe-2S family protein